MPESLSVGSATKTPTTAHTPAAANRASGLAPPPRWPTTTAPIPAKVIWQSDRRPAYPTTGTNDSPTMARPHTRLMENRSDVETTVAITTANNNDADAEDPRTAPARNKGQFAAPQKPVSAQA